MKPIEIHRLNYADETGEIVEGDFVKHEDHLAALRDIFPEWPGEYPTEDGVYYFDTLVFGIHHVQFVKEYESDDVYFAFAVDGKLPVSRTKPKQWGPRVPMLRKV